jgi:hypothetical protein
MKGAKGAHAESQLSRGSWMTVDQAAVFLHLPRVTLRRALERNARKLPEGGITSHIDGIAARKLGRLWRLWLDAGWLNPGASK